MKPVEGLKTGAFVLYQREDAGGNGAMDTAGDLNNGTVYEIKKLGADQYDLYTIGTDGSYTTPTGFGSAFANWDLVYQGGKIKRPGDLNVSAYFLHADLGANIDRLRLTYTTWYASGDSNPNDGDLNNFMATDIDIKASVIFMEGGYTSDNYFTESSYIKNKGMYLNKLAADYKATKKTSFGAAVLYLMTAEDLTLPSGSTSKSLGTELDAHVSHKLYSNLEVSLNAGYLFSGDGMDAFTGSTETAANIFRTTTMVRYRF